MCIAMCSIYNFCFRRSYMIASAYSHVCTVIVQAAILVGWIGPMSVHRLVQNNNA